MKIKEKDKKNIEKKKMFCPECNHNYLSFVEHNYLWLNNREKVVEDSLFKCNLCKSEFLKVNIK